MELTLTGVFYFRVQKNVQQPKAFIIPSEFYVKKVNILATGCQQQGAIKSVDKPKGISLFNPNQTKFNLIFGTGHFYPGMVRYKLCKSST